MCTDNDVNKVLAESGAYVLENLFYPMLVVLRKTSKNCYVFGLKSSQKRIRGCELSHIWTQYAKENPITTFCLAISLDLNFSSEFGFKF